MRKEKGMGIRERKRYIKAAIELEYSEAVIERLSEVKTSIEADRIMVDARNGRI